MDSITHALYRVIVAEHDIQRAADQADEPFKTSGLQPVSKRKPVWDTYPDAAGTDLHVAFGSETCFAELLALQLEFVAAGFSPPAGMVTCGADVFISPGRIDVYVPSDDGEKTWSAILASSTGKGMGRKAGWTEEMV